MSFWSTFKHAFAIPDVEAEPTPLQAAVVERVCREVERRGMVTPALMMLETSQPLTFLTAQLLHFFEPLLTTVLDPPGYQAFAEFLERRDACERMIRLLTREPLTS